MKPGEWLYSTTHKSACRLLEENELWGNITCRVILPDKNTIVTVPKETLKPLTGEFAEISSYHIRYVALAAKLADILEGNPDSEGKTILLAPVESNVIPLPHQLTALNRAVSNERIRYLLADEVGLGKTIEAGLIMRELKLRGLIRRILIVAPKGLTEQWVSEMKTHFNEDFSILLPKDIQTLKKLAPSIESIYSGGISSDLFQKDINPWTVFSQVITPMDSVKPLDKRKGWSKERISLYNKDRFEDLITAGWDLIIIDESHRLGGSTDLVARYKLGKGLAESSPYLLLLSATPHQGKTESFFRLISLLDQKMFPDSESITREKVGEYVIRTIKRDAIDSEGRPLFKPRKTELYSVKWLDHHNRQKELYEAVTEYIKIGYNEAISEKKQYIGFLMVLMQRLVTSSTAAIENTLQHRLEVLSEIDTPYTYLSEKNRPYESEITDEIYDMDGQELLDTVINSGERRLSNESGKVKELLTLANECRQTGPDVKAEALIDLIYKLRTEEQNPDLKILIFTEFISTQEMLFKFLTGRGFSAEILNGRMSLEERNRAQDKFMQDAQFLISTDAGGEGLNLQFCHVVINYDIPWNPMKLEQRIGRVDRIGQEHTVKAINFVFENSVEFRVREVLEEKLAIIYEEFGVNKTGDVLDSAIAGEIFEDLFIETIINPQTIESSVNQAVSKIHDEMKDIKKHSVINSISDLPDIEISKKTGSHPFSYWIERMTISYLLSHNGSVKQLVDSWNLTWPDGTEYKNAVFSESGKTQKYGSVFLTPKEKQIREIISDIPECIPDKPVPQIYIPDLPENVSGYWGLFEISFSYEKTDDNIETLRFIPSKKKKYLPVFLSEDNMSFRQTASFIWDCLLSKYYNTLTVSDIDTSTVITGKLIHEAKLSGEEIFNELKEEHKQHIQTEKIRANTSFSARKRAIEKTGLPEVRNYRLKELQKEHELWQTEINSAELIIPNLKPLIILRINKGRE
ncbi:MAG: helicase-related protein [Euryarchaeota archaeon]|nr:helicase-related protein [Euryarchaeota archaeon]